MSKPKLATKSKTIKMADLFRPGVDQALVLLGRSDLPIKTSYELLMVVDALNEHKAKGEALRKKIVEKFGVKNEAGELETNADKTEYLLADKDSFDKEYQELMQLDVEIPCMALSAFPDIKIPPAMLICLVRTILDPEA